MRAVTLRMHGRLDHGFPNQLADIREFLRPASTVEAWTLTGRGGLVLEAITYGGIVTRSAGAGSERRRWTTWCWDSTILIRISPAIHILARSPGRVAGRIAGAAFTLDGNTYRLAR